MGAVRHTEFRTLKLYSPHELQMRMHTSRARYRVSTWGRQSGKSSWAINELTRCAWRLPGTTYWLISPTSSQARVLYRRLLGMLWPCREVLLKKNQTEMRIKLANMSQIVFKSGDKPDSLRTETLHGAVIDEVRDQDKNLWPMVILPMLKTTKGWAAFISTPNGYDHFYDLCERARRCQDGQWEFWQSPSTCNPLWTPDEVKDAQENMSLLQYRQEVLAEFIDLFAGQVYTSYGDHNVRATSPFTLDGLPSKYLPIVVGMDFNNAPMAWTLGQHNGRQLYWHDEIWLERAMKGTEDAAKELVERVRGHAPGVQLIGDASGNSIRSSSAGKSDYDITCQILTEAGIPWENLTPAANPGVKDRVNAVNALWCSALGTVSMWHHPRCTHLRHDMQRVRRKENKKGGMVSGFVIDKDRDATLTHPSDGVGYAVHVLQPVPSQFLVGGLDVISAA